MYENESKEWKMERMLQDWKGKAGRRVLSVDALWVESILYNEQKGQVRDEAQAEKWGNNTGRELHFLSMVL